MNRNFSYLLLGALSLTATATGPSITPAEREQALTYLNQTRNGVVAATKGLTQAQWTFKPAPDRWSVAEVVEHLALIEAFANQSVFAKLASAPPPAAGWDATKVDALVLTKVPDRSTKFQAPEPAVPTGRWSPEETLQHFLTRRSDTVAFLNSMPDLRGHVLNHPVFGPMDGYEWILAAAAHTERHTKQILEVKADPAFPK